MIKISKSVQTRPDKPLIVAYDHGSVGADWSVDKATGVARGANYNFYVTDVAVDIQADLTAEIDTAESVQMRVVVHNDTTSADVAAFTFGIPQNTHIALNTPLMLKVNNQFATHVQLGGATAATSSVYLIGFEY